MLKFLKFDKNRFFSLLIAIATFLVVAILYTQLNIFDSLETGSIDTRFKLKAPGEYQKSLTTTQGKAQQYKQNPNARQDIMIIGIDEDTLRSDDFSKNQITFPFPWDVHTKVTKCLRSGDPQAIFFDIMFLDHKKYEQEFAKAISDAGNVFLDYSFETAENNEVYSDQQEREEILNKMRWPKSPDDTTEPWVKEVVPPIPSLAKASKGIGYANIKTDPDQINRKLPVYIQFNNYYYPSIDLVLVMNYFGITKDDVEIHPGKYVKLKNLPVEKMKSPNPQHEILIPIDERGFMAINFIGGPGSYEKQSYLYFYDDYDLQGQMKDKILLVAVNAATGIAKDTHKSPYGETFGIEHHANALNTILNQNFLYKLSDYQNLFILFAIALLLGFLIPRMSIIVSLVMTGMFTIAYMITSYIVFAQSNIIISFATPLLETGFVYMLIVVYRVMTEQQEKKYIRSTFSKFVSKSVVDELLKDPKKLQLGGEKKILTVLFSDIRGFTTLSEGLSPEQLVVHLNEYLQAMTDIVFDYNGTLDKYVGDEIMAFWGAPIPSDKHAEEACIGALKMMEVLAQLNAKWKSEGRNQLDIGIGLNSGEMVVGNMGSASRMDYTLMGDNVNLGARLEGTNKVYKTHIIISEFTYEMVKDKVIVRELDLIKVKGKDKPVKIFELVDMK